MTANNKSAVSPKTANPFRQTANILALAMNCYRKGDVESAFDLFIGGMEEQLKATETASAPDDFSAIIEQALADAVNLDAPPASLRELNSTPRSRDNSPQVASTMSDLDFDTSWDNEPDGGEIVVTASTVDDEVLRSNLEALG